MTLLPQLETKRLLLKELTLEHADDCQKKFGVYDIIGELTTRVPWPYGPGEAEKFIKNSIMPNQGKTVWVWGIFLKDQPDEVIGAIEIRKIGPNGNRGFWMEKKHWHKGYMSEAIEPVTDFAFDVLGFDKLKLCNSEGNVRSRKLKEKSGATFVKMEPAQFVDPKYKKKEVWELTKENWRSYKASLQVE